MLRDRLAAVLSTGDSLRSALPESIARVLAPAASPALR